MLQHSEKINKQAPKSGGLFKSITKYYTISQDFYLLLQNTPAKWQLLTLQYNLLHPLLP